MFFTNFILFTLYPWLHKYWWSHTCTFVQTLPDVGIHKSSFFSCNFFYRHRQTKLFLKYLHRSLMLAQFSRISMATLKRNRRGERAYIIHLDDAPSKWTNINAAETISTPWSFTVQYLFLMHTFRISRRQPDAPGQLCFIPWKKNKRPEACAKITGQNWIRFWTI